MQVAREASRAALDRACSAATSSGMLDNRVVAELPIGVTNPWAAVSDGLGDRANYRQCRNRHGPLLGLAVIITVSTTFWIGLGVLIARLW